MSTTYRYEAAKAALTDKQFLTWALHERGLSPRSIAAYRRVTRATVIECLDTCELRIEEAMNGQDQDTAAADSGRA